jgi:hypothetical protein
MTTNKLQFAVLCAACVIAAIVCARAQDSPEPAVNEWALPELPDKLHAELCHKDFLQFWRLKSVSGGGNWHLYNVEDKAFLSRWKETVQWTAIEGKLPK